MRALLLAEKPSVMRAIQEVYKREKLPDEIEFGAFHGHLMELKSPEEYDPAWEDRRNNAILPMIPAEFAYAPQDKEAVAGLMAMIKKGHFDYLINACDAGREGEHIFWSFYETEGLTLPVKRFWASSVTKPAIKKALCDLKDAKLYDGLRQAAKYRAQFDWLVGMNFTRAATNQLGRFVSVGRVQSPTLKIIVDRELEIQRFLPEQFYETKIDWEVNGKDVATVLLLPPENKSTRTDKGTASAALDRAKRAKRGVIKDIKETVKDTYAPTLYSLTELQKDANKYLKFSADRTLAIAQKLYESGLLTYPRTESRYLPTDMIPEIPQHLAPIQEVPELAQIANGIGQQEINAMLKKGYINDSGITDHHAIIPTDQRPNFSSLSKEEQAIYTLVCKAFLAIFLSPYKVATTTLLVAVGDDLYKGQGRRVIDPGYSVLYQTKAEKEILIPACKKGDPAIFKKGKVAEGTTKPPQRYSPRTILSAMMNAGEDLPDKAMQSVMKDASGIGTPATRAEILKKLEERKFVEVKDNLFYATESGINLIKAVGERTFCSPMLTAQWEQKLGQIEEGKYTGDFRGEMIQYVQEEVQFLLGLTSQRMVVGKCPFCGGDIIENENGWYCRNKKQDDPSSCKFNMSRVVGGTTLTNEDLVQLVVKGSTRSFKIIKKNGSEAIVTYVLVPGERRTALVYANNDRVVGKCPFCGGDIIAADNGWFCSSRRGGKDKCGFSLNKVVGGTTLTDEDVVDLITKKETREFVFTTKDKRMPKAKYILSESKKTVSLSFVQEEKEIGVCPRCGKPMLLGEKGMYCSGWKDKICDFSVSRVIKGAVLEEADFAALLSGRWTEEHQFHWSNGKVGPAKLHLEGTTLKFEFLQ